jgi:N-dimethylarginine dimethylaminohydrolase
METNYFQKLIKPLKTYDEFTALKAIIVGNPFGANHPPIDASFQNFFQPPDNLELRAKAVGRIPKAVIDEIEEDLTGFIAVLEAHGVEVIRPKDWDSTIVIKTPFWETSQLYSLMPRDCLLAFGDLVIETASPTRARFFESFAFREILDAFSRKGAHIISMPRPLLDERTFDSAKPFLITENEALLDAANCIRLGQDVFVDVNRTANICGVKWLERTLKAFAGEKVKVHPMQLGYDHVDVTLIPIGPGFVLVDPEKVKEKTIPPQFKNWDKIVVDEVMPTRDYGLPYPFASNDGIGRNILMLNPKTVIVDDIQLTLIKALETRGFTVIPLQYRHGRTLGGSWHCITLDTHREGEIESYF